MGINLKLGDMNEKMGIDCMGMGESGNVNVHSRSSLFPAVIQRV